MQERCLLVSLAWRTMAWLGGGPRQKHTESCKVNWFVLRSSWLKSPKNFLSLALCCSVTRTRPGACPFSLHSHAALAAAWPWLYYYGAGTMGGGLYDGPAEDRAGLLPWRVPGKRHIGNSSSSASLGKFFSAQHHKNPTSTSNITIVFVRPAVRVTELWLCKYCLLPSILQFKLMFHMIIFLVNILFVCVWIVTCQSLILPQNSNWPGKTFFCYFRDSILETSVQLRILLLQYRLAALEVWYTVIMLTIPFTMSFPLFRTLSLPLSWCIALCQCDIPSIDSWEGEKKNGWSLFESPKVWKYHYPHT